MQGHFGLGDDRPEQLRETFDGLRELGLEVVVNELDIDVVTRDRWWADGGKHREALALYGPYKDGFGDGLQEQLNREYVGRFKLFTDYADIIERVSIWNVNDGQSWLNTFPWRRVNHLLLFDRERRPKPCFGAVYEFLKPGDVPAPDNV